jgi:PAS domain S-box-containing protein
LLEQLVIDPDRWQMSLFALILRGSVFLGALVYLPSVYASVQYRLYGLAVIDTVALVTLIGLNLFDRLPFPWRAATFCLILYGLAVGLLISVGPISQIYLFAFSILTALLLGLRAGFIATLLSSVTLFAVGSLGYAAATMTITGWNQEIAGWTAITLNFTLVNTMLTLAIGAVVKALEYALTREVAAGVSLERERSLLRTLFDALPVIIFTKDLNGAYVNGNQAALANFGLQHEDQLVGKTLFELIPRDLAEIRHAEDIDVIAGRPLYNRVDRSVDRAGNPIWYATTKVPLRGADGEIVGLIGIARDITNLRQAEAERALLLSQLQLQIERMPLAYMLTDSNLRYSRWNPAAERIFGFSEAEVIGKHPFDIIVPPNSQPAMANIFDNAKSGSMDAHGEFENRTKDGRTLICEWHNTPLFEESGAFVGLLSLAEDITARKNLETQLRQSQKMEGIGTLAGGVAHDFNNILAIIQMQTDFLKDEGDLSASQMECADDIVSSVQRTTALTRQLLLFSSREIFQPRDLDLSASIADMVKMLKRIVGEHIEMQLNMAPQAMFLHADPGMIDQVLLNLVVNARDAMPDGGRLLIETSAVEFDELAASQTPGARVGPFVCLSVSDTGCGIPPDIVTKIFEPFFTTKDVGKGTGLGLSTVFGIARQHHGWVNVYSEVGHGTTFRVYLPRLAKTAEAKLPQAAALKLAGGGSETILLVEDDPAVRVSVRRSLTQLGYRVIEAPSGVKAVEVWKENRDEIRLLLTDLMMPDGMSGRDLAQRILRENPELKVVYMSGYSADVVGKDFPMKEGIDFLTKPFAAHALAQTVRNCLDRD